MSTKRPQDTDEVAAPRFDLPVIEPETQPSWDAARDGRFLVRRCRACGLAHHYPRPFCPECWSEDLVWEEVTGRGTLYTFSTVFVNDLPPFAAACLAIVIYASAYFGEIWRGGILSVPKTQWEAAECLALSDAQRFWLIIVPQALRLSTPPTVGFMVQIVKSTSVASLIGLTEVARASVQVNTVTFEPVWVFGTASAIYFALCWPLSLYAGYLERKLAVGDVRKVEKPMVAA